MINPRFATKLGCDGTIRPPSGSLANPANRALDLDVPVDINTSHLDREGGRDCLSCAQKRNGGGRVRTEEHGYPLHAGRCLLEYPQPFAPYGWLEVLETADICTRSRQAGDKTAVDWVGDLS